MQRPGLGVNLTQPGWTAEAGNRGTRPGFFPFVVEENLSVAERYVSENSEPVARGGALDNLELERQSRRGIFDNLLLNRPLLSVRLHCHSDCPWAHALRIDGPL